MSISVIDFFSGCGGTSLGFKDAGMYITCAIDIDADALKTLKTNIPEVDCIQSDIRDLKPEDLKKYIGGGGVLFSACAPCQPFTKQHTLKNRDDRRVDLLSEFSRFVSYFQPDHIFLENVPGLQNMKRFSGSPLDKFLSLLEDLEYFYESKVIKVSDYGVPQTRQRFILLASRDRPVIFPPKTHGNGKDLEPLSTARDWIGYLPPIKAGEVCTTDPEHQAAKLSDLNMKRIKSTPMGGSRLSWPEDLQLTCHKSYTGHTDVYGRMHWDRPASGLTTRCISYSNGRYGHPDQDRAISVREAGRLQTFPETYRWSGNLHSKAKQIGNAVPPLLARKLAYAFIAPQVD